MPHARPSRNTYQRLQFTVVRVGSPVTVRPATRRRAPPGAQPPAASLLNDLSVCMAVELKIDASPRPRPPKMTDRGETVPRHSRSGQRHAGHYREALGCEPDLKPDSDLFEGMDEF